MWFYISILLGLIVAYDFFVIKKKNKLIKIYEGLAKEWQESAVSWAAQYRQECVKFSELRKGEEALQRALGEANQERAETVGRLQEELVQQGKLAIQVLGRVEETHKGEIKEWKDEASRLGRALTEARKKRQPLDKGLEISLSRSPRRIANSKIQSVAESPKYSPLIRKNDETVVFLDCWCGHDIYYTEGNSSNWIYLVDELNLSFRIRIRDVLDIDNKYDGVPNARRFAYLRGLDLACDRNFIAVPRYKPIEDAQFLGRHEQYDLYFDDVHFPGIAMIRIVMESYTNGLRVKSCLDTSANKAAKIPQDRIDAYQEGVRLAKAKGIIT